MHWRRRYWKPLYPPIQSQIGCGTNACLCRADTLGSAEQILSSAVSQSCSYIQDISTVTSMLVSYSLAKGYMSIIEPTILATTGACTQAQTATATVTAYVTQYVTVSSTTCKNYQQQVAKIVSLPFWCYFCTTLRDCEDCVDSPSFWLLRHRATN